MQRFWLGCLLVCLVCLIGLAGAQTSGYQAGKIVNCRKAARNRGWWWRTDAPVKPETATYKISVQVNDTVYLVRYQAQGDADLSWIQGKDVQVKMSGKKMYVKRASGKDAKAGILSSTPANSQ